jgi:hypothetical protein
MDWGIIDEKVYPAMNIRFYTGYKIKDPDTKSGTLPFHYGASLDGINFKPINEDLTYVDSIKLNQESTLYVKTCLIPTLMDKPEVSPKVNLIYSLKENTFYTAFKFLVNFTFWTILIGIVVIVAKFIWEIIIRIFTFKKNK